MVQSVERRVGEASARLSKDLNMESSSSPGMEVVVSFSLPADEERKLLARATEKGKDVPSYLRDLVEKDLTGPPKLSDILAPIREDFRQSGMTEDELASLIEETRDDVWREKERGKPSS